MYINTVVCMCYFQGYRKLSFDVLAYTTVPRWMTIIVKTSTWFLWKEEFVTTSIVHRGNYQYISPHSLLSLLPPSSSPPPPIFFVHGNYHSDTRISKTQNGKILNGRINKQYSCADPEFFFWVRGIYKFGRGHIFGHFTM